MTRASVFFLRSVILLGGAAVAAFLLVFPHFEGRNAQATAFEVYFRDPFLAYAYAGSTPFFVALYHMVAALGSADRRRTLHSLKTIRYCMIIQIVLIAGAELFFIAPMAGKDDIAGGVAMGIFGIIISAAIGTAAAMLERAVRSGD